MSPELVTHNKHVNALWNSKKFVSQIFNITVDEGHCMSEWGKEFRPEYSQLGRLHWILPPHIPFHIVSATMPPRILRGVISTLNMRRENISKHITTFLREQLPPELRDKIVWFHSGMTQEFRSEMIEKLRCGEIWGICCTDAAGMGLDIRDIELVIQWGYVKSLCTLMQRLGRGARGTDVEATGAYFVDRSYRKKKGKGNTKAGSKRKAKSQGGVATKKARGGGSASIAIEGHGISESGEGEGEAKSLSESSESESEGSGDDDGIHRTCQISTAGTEGTSGPDLAPTANPSQPQEGQSTPSRLLPPSSGLSEEEYECTVMDVFINAHNRSVCRRKIADEYFGNGSYTVVTDSESGPYKKDCCERCVKWSLKPRYCCDICNPQAFLLFFAPPPPKLKRARHLKLPEYKMELLHRTLKEDLMVWRQQQLVENGMDDDFFGPQLILTDKLLTRILDLSHHRKLPDISALKAQTHWVFANEYGPTILALVHKHFPQQPAPAPTFKWTVTVEHEQQ
ncbi:hypothetical protein PAXINDRAFT_16777 [Paxillus involutus ATCC 200175]|uniref:DNA 3'-5' helicase n=1 Tax=Paxillus involutus ATCC 200175 TaxID=664439 RepID=A0A0C9TSR2_PAXIN|nr:hypothetical protein PAXINDRAFT_16777 [Paxillus involutus ATCC 200175]